MYFNFQNIFLLERDNQIDNVAKRLGELRSVMSDVVTKKCDGDLHCMQRYGLLSKKDTVETPPERFRWQMVTSGCSVSCGTGWFFFFNLNRQN